jgi:hypothetical protein
MEPFILENYGRKSTFASFLPGIAGEKGIPIWCYYVNRGQAVVSFGVDNKDHAIMEFYPAHTAYQNAKRTGFRTFLRRDGEFFESFSDEEQPHRMEVGMNSLVLEETNEKSQVRTKVTYFVLPEERIGGLVRKVEIENLGEEAEIEILDGMPALIPYGVSLDSVKSMAQLAKAWMQVEEPRPNLPFYRVRASMVDTASVTEVKGGNFAYAMDENGERLFCIYDPEVIFGYDNSLEKPVAFRESGLKNLLTIRQNRSNLMPAAFFANKKILKQGEKVTFYELIGQVDELGALEAFLDQRKPDPGFFEEKRSKANAITDELTDRVQTETGSKTFDEYTRYTFMDNVLRGGLPVKIGKDKIFYVYSRKHGDLEREYNYFAMSPEFYSQGNGNYRDVNQNRRLDSFFAPFTEKESIKMFYSLIQADGYNPLAIEKLTYTITDEKLDVILKDASDADRVRQAVQGQSFTPGKLALACEDEAVFARIMEESDKDVNATFGEGYWSDHWTYNLDLVEEYLSLYPDREEELLFTKEYTYFASQVRINPRRKRYELVDGKVRQYHALDESSRREGGAKLLQTTMGETYVGTLLEKLILMCTVKTAALDPMQMGIDMEGGKPGWYDALNGLPGILGSSMAETYELARMLNYTVEALERHCKEVVLFEEIADLLQDLVRITEAESDAVRCWNAVNDRKEQYWKAVYDGISGRQVTLTADVAASLLKVLQEKVNAGIRKAEEIGQGICPTYFYYDVTDYTEDQAGIHPTAFECRRVPHFLEGPVRYLKLDLEDEKKRELYRKVKDSDLYDSKLRMYKVNGSLESASYELGRCRCFTPGWLENESIWLHMEYKYLLEVLRSGLYDEYARDLETALIPFMDPEVYGRSILENSSFIASSANPDEKIHGKGFVARLSGSTIEFLSMWKLMMFGKTPFRMRDGELIFEPTPVIPDYLLGEDKKITARFMSMTDVTYHFPEKKDYFPGTYSIEEIRITGKDGQEITVIGGCLRGDTARLLRDGQVSKLEIRISDAR